MESDQIIKLGRLGMSMEEVDVNAEYCDPKDVKMPKMVPDARRNAPEVLSYRSYTRKSDVWSFGVVVWEFFKIASLRGTDVTRKDVAPYSEISDNEILALVMDKTLLPNPDQYSSHLYNAYKTCWNWNAEDRPSILSVLNSITTSNAENKTVEEEEIVENYVNIDDLTSENTALEHGEELYEPVDDYRSYSTDHEDFSVCYDNDQTPQMDTASAFYKYDIGKKCGDTSLNVEEARDDYEAYGSGIYPTPKNEHDLYYNTEHEYSPVCNDDVNISSAPDSPGPSGEQVDDVHKSISEQDSGENNAQEDTSAEEVVDIASHIGNQGHVKNMIAMFSPPDR